MLSARKYKTEMKNDFGKSHILFQVQRKNCSLIDSLFQTSAVLCVFSNTKNIGMNCIKKNISVIPTLGIGTRKR